jgi:hypothetical protein
MILIVKEKILVNTIESKALIVEDLNPDIYDQENLYKVYDELIADSIHITCIVDLHKLYTLEFPFFKDVIQLIYAGCKIVRIKGFQNYRKEI